VGVIADVERELARLRARDDDGATELRTSTATHVVWAPPRWLEQARSTLDGLAQRHPSRVVFLVPEPGRRDAIESSVAIREFAVGEAREIVSEVIELRLRGVPARHPGSIVLPLLIADLPAFCRWRGEPDWDRSSLAEIAGACDRLVVDSAEWPSPGDGYGELARLFGSIAVSDLAFRRSLPWRVALAGLWPAVADARWLRVDGPRADALLVAGWLRSRLRRDVTLARRPAAAISRLDVDGRRVDAPEGEPRSPADLLSEELDVLGRDPVYEAAVRAARD
jgi:glucose-6-phosphate dehydrogenase assembly protein OpcA